MITYDVRFKDYDGKDKVKKVSFHISRETWIRNLEFQERFSKIEKILEGPKKDVNPDEIRLILDLVKDIMQLGYGVLEGAENDEFNRSPELWDRFSRTEAYDKLLWQLFDPEDKEIDAMNFLTSLLPQELRDASQAEIARKMAEQAAVTQTPELDAAAPVLEKMALTDNRPAWERENREPTQKELMNMSPDEMRRAFMKKGLNG